MAVGEIVPLALLVERCRQQGNGGIVADLGAGGVSVRSAVTECWRAVAAEFWIFVGSEGGFSAAEVEQLTAVPLRCVSLGTTILRVETACIALVSIVRSELGQLG